MANYFLSHKAMADLSEIWNYTFDIWSENQADKYYKDLIGGCNNISENSKIGKCYDEIDKDIFGFRAGNHIIFYRLTPDNKIEILRILHQNMDLKNRIKE
jgi:toxin ParE1/3/4